MDTNRDTGKENRWWIHQKLVNQHWDSLGKTMWAIKLQAEVHKATDTAKQKRLKLAGHCYQHPEKATSNRTCGP